MPKRKKPVETPLALHWFKDDHRECYRVWNSRWFGDQFESMTEVQMESLQITCRKFGIPLVEMED